MSDLSPPIRNDAILKAAVEIAKASVADHFQDIGLDHELIRELATTNKSVYRRELYDSKELLNRYIHGIAIRQGMDFFSGTLDWDYGKTFFTDEGTVIRENVDHWLEWVNGLMKKFDTDCFHRVLGANAPNGRFYRFSFDGIKGEIEEEIDAYAYVQRNGITTGFETFRKIVLASIERAVELNREFGTKDTAKEF